MNHDKGIFVQPSAAAFAGYDTFYALQNTIFVCFGGILRSG